jgi:hypothetical protein
MRDPLKIFMLLWLLCLTIYVGYAGIGMGGDEPQMSEVAQRVRALEETATAQAPMSGFNQALPRTGGFKILHAPNGKWRLFRGDVWIADFDTHEAAEIGMKLCINPEVHRYDAVGQMVKG